MEQLLNQSAYAVSELADYIEKNKRFPDEIRFILLLDKINLMIRGAKIAAVSSEQQRLKSINEEIKKITDNENLSESEKEEKLESENNELQTVFQELENLKKAFELVQDEFDNLEDFVRGAHGSNIRYNSDKSTKTPNTSDTSHISNNSDPNHTVHLHSTNSSYNVQKITEMMGKRKKHNRNKSINNMDFIDECEI